MKRRPVWLPLKERGEDLVRAQMSPMQIGAQAARNVRVGLISCAVPVDPIEEIFEQAAPVLSPAFVWHKAAEIGRASCRERV